MNLYSGPIITHPQHGDFHLFGTDDAERVWIRWHNPADENDMNFDVMHEYDVEALLEDNAEAAKATVGRRMGNYNRIGSVPHDISRATGLDDAMRNHDRAWVHKWFRDNDNKKFRTSDKI